MCTSASPCCPSPPSPPSRATAWAGGSSSPSPATSASPATAVFGLPEVGIGILPSSGGTHRLVRLVGAARAKELILLRDRGTATELHALGLLTEVVQDGEGLDRALVLAERLAALPPVAVAVAKQAIDAMPDASRDTGLTLERLAYGLLSQTEAARAAAETFGRRP